MKIERYNVGGVDVRQVDVGRALELIKQREQKALEERVRSLKEDARKEMERYFEILRNTSEMYDELIKTTSSMYHDLLSLIEAKKLGENSEEYHRLLDLIGQGSLPYEPRGLVRRMLGKLHLSQ
ncbi:hypothetical protein HZA33_00655 [Candidatus Pacearchaeota archaeon]|nr:hypothetical protein [Candidatus Pacearchaeota archaeon]